MKPADSIFEDIISPLFVIVFTLCQPSIAILCVNTLLGLDIQYTPANYISAATLIFIIKWK
jgi:hypothetical protein